MNFKQKFALYRKILAGLSKGVNLEAVLREQGAGENEIQQIEKKNEELAETARKLREQLSAEWMEQTEDLEEQIGSINSKLQRQIREIETTRESAEKVVNAVGYLDDLMGIAGKLIGV